MSYPNLPSKEEELIPYTGQPYDTEKYEIITRPEPYCNQVMVSYLKRKEPYKPLID